jgi:hypothetical protein
LTNLILVLGGGGKAKAKFFIYNLITNLFLVSL